VSLIFTFAAFFASFKTQILSVPGSLYHWGYYIGPMISYSDGLPISKIPSQYGLFNILLASYFPGEPLISFYLFQSSLLWFVYVVTIILVIRTYMLNMYPAIFFMLVFYLALYFADPELIGPQPFPSSSVVRFFPVYMYAWICLSFSTLRSRSLVLLIATLISFFWSAEGYLYASVIMLSILTWFLLRKSYRESAKLAIVLIVSNIILLLSGHFAKLFEFATGYAAGHGYVDFKLTGISQLFICAIVVAFIYYTKSIHMERNDVSSSVVLGALIGISTYFTGRPVPQNFTAMLPIIFLLIFVLFSSSRINNIRVLGGLDKVVFLLISFISCLPLLDYKFYKQFANIEISIQNLLSDRIVSSPELDSLTGIVNDLCNKRVSILDDSAALLIFSGCKSDIKSWLPMPLQLVEAPISKSKRAEYIDYYINQFGCGLLIVDKNSIMGMKSNEYVGIIEDRCKLYNVQRITRYDIYEFKSL